MYATGKAQSWLARHRSTLETVGDNLRDRDARRLAKQRRVRALQAERKNDYDMRPMR